MAADETTDAPSAGKPRIAGRLHLSDELDLELQMLVSAGHQPGDTLAHVTIQFFAPPATQPIGMLILTPLAAADLGLALVAGAQSLRRPRGGRP